MRYLSITNRTDGGKTTKYIDLNDMITIEYTFSLSASGPFTKIKIMLDHKANFSTSQENEIMHNIFYEHGGIKL
jgi:hypothetical protein